MGAAAPIVILSGLASRALLAALRVLCVQCGAVVIMPAFGVNADNVAAWNRQLEVAGLVATHPAQPFIFPDGSVGHCLEISEKRG